MSTYVAPPRGASLLIPDHAHLTAGEVPDLERVRGQTGQASWAVGPQHCPDCVDGNDAGGKRSKSPKIRACQKSAELMGTRGPRVPASALVCRFFEMTDEARARRALLETF